jgi:alkanesulfonate monooxygenase SsuD/methylene tetrahydromethanopterin reductase-like flavin-dependent oxidoreductase (luciferase family)
MRVWIFQIGQRYNLAVDDRKIFANLLDEAVLAEDLGFEGVWAAEHHFSNYASVTNPLLYLAAVAQRTTTLRVGSMAVVLPLHHPVRVAEEVAMLDNLSNGRVEVGVARGYSRYEYGGLGISLDDSKQAMAQGLDVLAASWADTDISFEGYGSLSEPRTVTPRPYQRPFPKMWYACGSESTIDSALDRDMNVIQALGVSGFAKAEQFAGALQEKLSARNLDKSQVRYGVQIPAHITHSDAETADAVEQARWMYRLSGQLVQNTQQVKGGFFQPAGPVQSAEVSIEQCASGSMIGSPEHARELVERMKGLGVTDLSLNFEFGNFTHEQRCDSLREVSKALELSR